MALSGFKRKRKRRRTIAVESDPNPEFQVAPMADLLFVLLVFFMSITSVEVLRKEKGIDLPVAKDSQENKQKSHQIVVNVLWTDTTGVSSIKIDDQPYPTPDSIVPILKERLGRDPVLRVLIRADKDVHYAYISEIMKACGQAQISDVTFAVLSKDANAPRGTTPGG